MFDLIVQNATLVDGSGSAGRRADVAVADDRIAEVGDLGTAEAREWIDAAGRVVCPGFVDMHTHSDLALLLNPEAHSKVRQGVTTEVIGNCGTSPAPFVGPMAEQIKARMSTTAPPDLVEWDWCTMGDYLGRLAEQGTALNVVGLVGHVTLRIAAMGFERRPPTDEELARMQQLLAESLRDGAFGMSTGLMTPPSSFSDTEELVALAEVLHAHGALYFSHIRGEGRTLFRATAEAIEIGERAGVPVEIAHHKAAFRPSWGWMPRVLTLSDWARERGVEVNFDVYPYTAGSAGMTQLIPDWAHAGGLDALLGRLNDSGTRERIRADVDAFGREWDRTYLTTVSSEANREYEGRHLADIAEARGMTPTDTLFSLLLEEHGRAGMLHHIMRQDDVDAVIAHPLCTIGSDGSSLRPDGALGQGKPHPRSYGTFPRVLQEYVRERGVLRLEDAIHKMTGLAAEKLGLSERGLIERGRYADLVVFDPATIREVSTYGDPHRYPEGIDAVVVNGQIVVRNGEHTGWLPGRVLQPSSHPSPGG
ncbi:MAG: D-aminoacylase [Chloroflexi bacterium]|nr:D-aminoacylase [Chloroflexota bacterium]